MFQVLLSQATIVTPSILPTPPMGFNNWARFMCDLNETLFVTTADAMASTGLLAAGYNRLNLDDCWMQTSRAGNGSLLWNTTLFPQGIPWLANYVKSKGFHFGIYEDSGNLTCGGYPGSKGHEELDVETFASWGIDYLKLDGCNVQPEQGYSLEETYMHIYGLWHRVISKHPKPLIFSESAPAYFSGGSDFPKQMNLTDWYRSMYWAPLYGELARHSNDIDVYGLYEPYEYWESIMTNYGFEVLLARYQQPGFYNDPDFIIADWPWLTLDEKKSQFALWASFSAPLIISAYVPNLSSEELSYLTNKDIIAVDQDKLGLQATLVSQDGTWDVLTKSLSNGDRLLTVLNRGNTSGSTTISLERLGLPSNDTYPAKNLWTGASTPVSTSIKIDLPKHATAIYRLSNISHTVPTGMVFNTASRLCLTAAIKSAILTNCTAADSQVWAIASAGTISPLSSPQLCLGGTNTSVSLAPCVKGWEDQQWNYHVTGNLKTQGSKACLTVNGNQTTLATCSDELEQQVFGLPSGVRVLRKADTRSFTQPQSRNSQSSWGQRDT